MLNKEKSLIAEKEKEIRLNDSEFRLNTIHKMRWCLLQMAHDVNEDHPKGYDDDFYIEANEILNEVERKVWEYVNGISDKY